MAEAQIGLGSVKRFGTRYGWTLKQKLAKIESVQKQCHKCPYCSKPKAYYVSYGIWECSKCGSKFTARAYAVGEKLSLAEAAAQMVAEAPEVRTKGMIEEEK